LTRFHRSLEGEGPQPFEHYIGRICEEFGCLPSHAWAEVGRLPVGFLEQVVEYRSYARTKAMVDGANSVEARRMLPKTALVDLVNDIEFALRQEEIDGAARG
jgi:hypothetical protein